MTTTGSGRSLTVTVDDVWPHLKTTIYITCAFCTAWSWDLAVYGASHVWNNENPLQNQLSFGHQQGPKHLAILLLQYLVVCGGAAVASDSLTRLEHKWSTAAVTAVEFFPAPVFAGKLMAYLGQYSKLSTLQRAGVNLAANCFAASLAHLMPMVLSSDFDPRGYIERFRLGRFGVIVQNTLGFGLGISWNLLLSQFAPEDQSSWTVVHFVAFGGYLAVVALVAFRLAAAVQEPPVTVLDRLLALLSFAFYVVCAFTLVVFVSGMVCPGWLGKLEALMLLLLLSAIMSALVTKVDLDRVSEREEQPTLKRLLNGPFVFILLVPCVWCCCPWIPVLWLLAGTTENVGVKEHWYQLIAMVSGLASSIEASGMLTEATDVLAETLGICNVKHCKKPWLFVLLQVGIAIVTTAVLIPIIAPLAPDPTHSESPIEQTGSDDSAERRSLLRLPFRKSSGATDSLEPSSQGRGERQSLLGRVTKKFRRSSGSK